LACREADGDSVGLKINIYGYCLDGYCRRPLGVDAAHRVREHRSASGLTVDLLWCPAARGLDSRATEL
jgi:hypothetical protein